MDKLNKSCGRLENIYYKEEYVPDGYDCSNFDVEGYVFLKFKKKGNRVFYSKDLCRNKNRMIEILPEILYDPLLLGAFQSSTGIPDLFAIKDNKAFFIEVKSNGDSLRIEQMKWMLNNPKVNKMIYVLRIIPKVKWHLN